MSEILKKARQRSERAIEDLEKQRTHREDTDSEGKPAAPWLNQLRKTAPIHPKPKPIRETPEINGTKEEDNVPEFIKKVICIRKWAVKVDTFSNYLHFHNMRVKAYNVYTCDIVCKSPYMERYIEMKKAV